MFHRPTDSEFSQNVCWFGSGLNRIAAFCYHLGSRMEVCRVICNFCGNAVAKLHCIKVYNLC